jgi:hypothetical protein
MVAREFEAPRAKVPRHPEDKLAGSERLDGQIDSAVSDVDFREPTRDALTKPV